MDRQLVAIKENMKSLRLIAIALFITSSVASAQDVLLAGHVQKVILQPLGTENCPPACPAPDTSRADGTQTVCLSNMGGCQTMEVTVDRVYRGADPGKTRLFWSRFGEWGPSFPVTAKQIVVSEENGDVSWSPITEKDGKIFIDPKRLRKIGGVPASDKGDSGLVALDEVLAGSSSAR
ncbi:hypothetical protein [Janthinobacterium aquaticum]|uniref:hypothetical protein n=1 Tax=Janthinobacterium sp. FT58W TaxID=2654254 RepID=UPI0012648706|nr:hypothetical protein [Janthinobacterium sp. FT58W]KAB8041540.1 hypothetical protein GCM43_17060 [Janthinobacterium sp. FT58W]